MGSGDFHEASVWIAFDDTDDYEQGCTTFVMYNFIKEFLKTRSEDRILGLPRLIRLNPYIPFKTRGNAAVALKVKVEDPRELLELGVTVVDEFSARGAKTSPGIVVSTTSSERWFYYSALSDVVPKELAERLITKIGAIRWGGRGVIGSLAAIMAELEDSTFELLSYRDGEERPIIDSDILARLSELTEPFTFANMDGKRPLIEPSTDDPVLFGVRGDSAYHVMYVGNTLLFLLGAKPRWLLYETNQGTGANFSIVGKRMYQPSIASGRVTSINRSGEGHVFMHVGGDEVVVYRHTGMAGLIGQYAIVAGGRRPGLIGNPIYAETLFSIDETVKIRNPRCPRCGAAMKSMGKGELRCDRCGFKSYLPRIVEGQYGFREGVPKMGERRHLAKLPERVGLEGLSKIFVMPRRWISW